MECIPSPLSKDSDSQIKHPSAIFIQLTTACNAKCINCPHPFTYGPRGHNPKGVMADKVWNKIIGDIQAMGYRNQVGLYLHHEPLLERSLFRKIRQINEETHAFAVISTNGSLLNEKNRRFLIDARPRIVHININSAEKNQYEKMTRLNFEATISQAKRFIAEADGKIHVEINCPVLPEVDIEKLIGLFPGTQVNTEYWANSRGGLLKGISSSEKGSRFKISDYCLQPEQNFNILFDGSVILCCNDWSHETKMDFANVVDQSIWEIYSGNMMRRVMEEFRSRDYGRYRICRHCAVEMGFIEGKKRLVRPPASDMPGNKSHSTAEKPLSILLATNHLFGFTGSEITLLTIANCLSERGHSVSVYAKYIDPRFTQLFNGVAQVHTDLNSLSRQRLEAAYVQHQTTALELRHRFPRLPMVMASLGVLPFLEQPPMVDLNIHRYLAISEEVSNNLIRNGVDDSAITIFRNIVDSRKFRPASAVRQRPQSAFIYSYKMDPEKIATVMKACGALDIRCRHIGEKPGAIHQDDLASRLNEADIVFTLGRGAIETMMCGRIPIIFDYLGGDGMVTPENVRELMTCNFSGRLYGKNYCVEEMIDEIKRYDPGNAAVLRRTAIELFDAERGVGTLVSCLKEAMNHPVGTQKPVARGKIESLVQIINTTKEFTEAALAKQKAAAAPASGICPDNQTVDRKKNSPCNAEQTDARLIAFYLPQYHPIPENDEWWGKGFTEWTNVAKAKPLFPGHYQPHLPGEFGFYDLRLQEARKAQADLAREYGIHGFCYYHYWFNGKLLLDRPLQEILKSGEPDFPFCLCWANENWTRKWDGGEKHILMEQKYNEDDDRQHLRHLCEIFRDRRYIRIHGRPLFLVYRANCFPDPLKTTLIWREEARKQGIGEIYLCRVESFPDEHDDPKRIGFDAAVEFQPDWTEVGPYERRGKDIDYRIYDHRKVVDRMLRKMTPPYMRFPCVNPTWDNSPRRRDDITIFVESTPHLYGTWLRETLKKWKPRDPEENIIFINAWNEWGEGNHLEPDEKFGRAYLEAQKKALLGLRNDNRDRAAECHAGILELFVAKGNHAEAVTALEDMLESFPDYSTAYNDLGVLNCELGNNDKALAAYEKAVSLEPGNATFRKNLADFYYAAIKRPEAAIPHYEKALFLNPRDTETLLILGNIRVESGDFHQARGYYLRVLEIDPSNDLAGNMFDALEAKAEKPEKRDPEILVREAKCLARRGLTDRAVLFLETLLSFCADHAEAHNDLGNLYCLLQKPDKGFFHLERAVHLAPEKIEYLRDLADAHLAEEGDLGRVLGLYNKALALKPDDIETLLRIGNLCAVQKQYDDARFFYNRVQSIEPENTQARENLAVLQSMSENEPSQDVPAADDRDARRLFDEERRAANGAMPSTASRQSASIVIPVFNQVEFTARCLEALYQNTPLDAIHEVLIVDNGSSDGTGAFLEEAMRRYPKLRVLTNRENLLFAKACNQGADVAGGKFLVFLNNDTEPLPGWLGNAITRLESDDSIGVVGIKLLYPDGTVQHCGMQFQRDAHPSYVIWPLHRHLRASAGDPRVNVPEDVHAVTGACLFIRRELFRRIGGFEERYGMYFEDTDLCFKARRAGKRVFYEPASVVIHHEGKSSPSRNVIDDLNTRAASLFFKTWKEDLCRIEIETLIEKEDGRYAYFPRDFWPGEVSPEEIVRMHRLLASFPSCYIHFGGSGDALLLLSTFYDRNPEQTIVSVANSTGMMKSFFDAFPKLKKVYFIPFPKNPTWHFIARRFFKASEICLGLGATPTTTADYREWNADLDIFKTYGIQQRPAWASDFGKNRLETRQVTLQPRGSLKGMVGSKRNALSTDDWARLLTYLEKKGVKPIVIGTPDEAAEYPCLGNAIDMRSYSFTEQMQLIAASDFFVGADSWGKTFSALAGIPTFVFHALRGDDLKNWKDASDYVFLDPWDEITVVKDFKAFRKSFDDAWRDRFPPATDLKIRWEGSQFVHHSLALVNRELCLRLIEEGCEVSIIPYERDQFTPKEEPRFKPIAERTRKPLCGPADVHVRHQWPPNFIPPPEGHWVIIQPWEFGSIPREWVRHMSASVDEAWVPSNYVRDSYIKSGVPSERVFVVPNGVNISLFNPDNTPYPLKTKKAFKFLFVGGTIQRKGIDILLEVYTKTFSSHDDVCLVIKDMGGQTFYKGQTAKHWIGQSQADPRSPEIEYIEQSLGDRQIAGLYTACNCLVHPYRGEGFGLPIAEAMASGLPVIVTGRGAALDFCDDKTAYLIPATEVRLPEKRIGEYDTVDFPWLAEPDKDGLARLMRHVVTNPQEAKERGMVASRHICSRFTWDRAADAVVRRVRELRKKPVMREVQNRPDMKPGEKPEATQHRDRKILDDARRYCQRGDLTAAVARYVDAMKKYPVDRAIFHELTEHLIATKRYKDALDILEKIPSGENDQMRIVLTGYCREGLDEDEEAGRLADRALQMDEHSARAVNLKGILACKRGDRREAEKLFRRAGEADPSWGEPYTNLGVLAWAEGEREAALDLLEKGFILTPHVEDIAKRYHEAAVSLGTLARAEAVYREARSLYPSSRTIAFLLIDLLLSQENYRTAMAEIETAMAAFDVDDGLIAAALEVRGRIGSLEIRKKDGGETISLCMIVKNEQPNLVRCLSSIKNVVDEIIVVDTGSEDRTKEIASIFGAKVFDAPWNDDFAEARNTALSKATGDWIFVLDADETLSPRDHGRLREFMRKVPGGADGYDLTTRNYVLEANTSGWTANDGSYADEEAGTGWYPNRKVRLFRNDPRIRFSGAVHELVEPSMQKAGMKIAACDVPVHHTGKLERVSVLEKGERYYRLGLKKVEESGGTPRAILELAIQAGELGRYDDAIMLWRRYLDGEPAQDVDRATVNLIHACLNADRFDEALSEARKAAGRATLSRELRLNCAAAEFFAGDRRKATRMAEKLLKKDPDYPPALVLLAASRALAGQHVKSAESLRGLHERGLEPHAQIRPVIEKLRKAGKPTEAEQLQGLLNRQFPADSDPFPPPPDMSRHGIGSSLQRWMPDVP